MRALPRVGPGDAEEHPFASCVCPNPRGRVGASGILPSWVRVGSTHPPFGAPGAQQVPLVPSVRFPRRPTPHRMKRSANTAHTAHTVHTGAPGLILLARGVMPPLVMPPYSCSPVSRAAKAIVACRAVRRRHHTPPARPAVGMRAPLALLFLWRCVLTWYDTTVPSDSANAQHALAKQAIQGVWILREDAPRFNSHLISGVCQQQQYKPTVQCFFCPVVFALATGAIAACN